MIDKKDIIHLAKLAKLKLTDTEIEELEKDLSKILKYIEKIDELDLKDIEPMSNLISKLETREDIELNLENDKKSDLKNVLGLIRKRIIENFSDKEDNYLKVPKIIEK